VPKVIRATRIFRLSNAAVWQVRAGLFRLQRILLASDNPDPSDRLFRAEALEAYRRGDLGEEPTALHAGRGLDVALAAVIALCVAGLSACALCRTSGYFEFPAVSRVVQEGGNTRVEVLAAAPADVAGQLSRGTKGQVSPVGGRTVEVELLSVEGAALSTSQAKAALGTVTGAWRGHAYTLVRASTESNGSGFYGSDGGPGTLRLPTAPQRVLARVMPRWIEHVHDE
jgi:hypothetical protein